jgi:hypothetical protein
MVAKSLDVFVVLKFLAGGAGKTYLQLSKELAMSASEVHAAARRCVAAGLLDEQTHAVLRKPLEEYLLHGVRYAFPAKRGPVVRGLPTAYAAPPLSLEISADDLPPVWPDAEGTTRGFAVEPLYRSVPRVARSDPQMYELLALVDALRLGRARERKAAEDELRKRLNHAFAS